jgi:hypothetical protein
VNHPTAAPCLVPSLHEYDGMPTSAVNSGHTQCGPWHSSNELTFYAAIAKAGRVYAPSHGW